MEVVRTEQYLLSTDNQSNLRVLIWEDENFRIVTQSGQSEKSDISQNNNGEAQDSSFYRGAIQIIHGMSEHVERYDHFARFLVSKRFLVVAHDHVGHGKSVSDVELLGHIPLSSGKKVLIEDVQKVRETFIPENLPYIVFGHSMGSFIARAFMARYGESAAAAIICGTGNQPKLLSSSGNFLSRTLCKMKGERHKSTFIFNLADGSYNKKIQNPRTALDWLSYNEKNVDDYINDPLSGALFTVGGYAALTDLTKEVVTPFHARQVPGDIPFFFIAGEEDPVGDCGKGVIDAVSLYMQAGVGPITTYLYPEMRHEILNETGNQLVYDDIAEWLDKVLTNKEQD